MTTYGEVRYSPEKRAWTITCEPHVSIRLKRVFGKLQKSSTGKHTVSDTPENARDLEWFLQRYPMTVQDEARLAQRSQDHRNVTSMVAAILEGRAAPPQFDLAIPARDYQRTAAAMVLARGALLLADDVGIGKTVSSILILSQAQLDKGVKMHAAEELSNTLRQATGIAKAPYVAEFVRLLLESGEKVVLYGWHHEVYSIWADRLAEFKPVFYTGAQSVPQKEEAKRRFIASETPLLIISLRSGAGLDGLQKVCRTVVFGELDWSPGVHEQCVGRIHRDGQAEHVAAYYLLAEDGVDPIMAEVLGVKRQQIEGIRRNPGEIELVEKLQNDGSHIRRLAEAYLADRKQEVAC